MTVDPAVVDLVGALAVQVDYWRRQHDDLNQLHIDVCGEHDRINTNLSGLAQTRLDMLIEQRAETHAARVAHAAEVAAHKTYRDTDLGRRAAAVLDSADIFRAQLAVAATTISRLRDELATALEVNAELAATQKAGQR